MDDPLPFMYPNCDAVFVVTGYNPGSSNPLYACALDVTESCESYQDSLRLIRESNYSLDIGFNKTDPIILEVIAKFCSIGLRLYNYMWIDMVMC